MENSHGAEIKVNIDLSGVVKQLEKIVVRIVQKELGQHTISKDNNVLLSKHQVCKMHHLAPKTLNKYILAGLPVLPMGKISVYDLNEFLGKYRQLKTHHKKNAV